MRASILTFVLTSASLIASAVAAPFPPAPADTVFCQTLVTPKGSPIVAVSTNTPIDGLELAVNNNTATLEEVDHRMGWRFENGGIAAWNYCHHFFLNTGVSVGSYLPLLWDFENQEATGWIAKYGQMIQWKPSPNSEASTTFLACETPNKGVWTVRLQMGQDKPFGETCYETQLWPQYIK